MSKYFDLLAYLMGKQAGGGGGGDISVVSGAVTGTFTPTSDLRSVVLSDCIGCTSIVVYPITSIVTTEAGKTHWGTMIISGTCKVTGATNGNGTAWSLITPASTQDQFDSTTGTLTIGYTATQNYGGYFASGMGYGYAAW